MASIPSATSTTIRVQLEPFDAGEELKALTHDPSCGAVVSFSGLVRDHNLGESVAGLFLEHYPGMTERALGQIVEQARSRWALGPVTVIHRVGHLQPNDLIVFVGVASAHRQGAFQAAEFIMDYLKTRAPFWKKEQIGDEARWLEMRDSDKQAAKRWTEDDGCA